MQKLSIVLAAAILATPGCATLFNGLGQRVEIVSDPPGAEVAVNGEPAGSTPVTVSVGRSRTNHRIRVGQDEVMLQRHTLSPLVWLNLPMGLLTAALAIPDDGDDRGLVEMSILGLMPIAADLVTGGLYRFRGPLDNFRPPRSDDSTADGAMIGFAVGAAPWAVINAVHWRDNGGLAAMSVMIGSGLAGALIGASFDRGLPETVRIEASPGGVVVAW